MASSMTHTPHPSPLASHPDDAPLEAVPAPHKSNKSMIRFTCPEFTTLCPRSGLPDFAHIILDYVPHRHILESKSFKLFLSSFRHHHDFHEACTLMIAQRVEACIAPTWLRIGGYWYPRGGLPIDIFYQTAPPPQNLWIPDHRTAPYRGRG
ncbi:MAG: NADPH-dependent 7-cyano-7-deazaguanine reductase QueF [Alphaproteobacteria bacterium GM7ARS4]|nr:NADPH-dependent 7-cyano-7-deazaguanine reductase QueF [Alphaproteobacteria bacterium GM7ARS4]